MNKPMKQNAFFFCAAMAGLLAVSTPTAWASENHEQHSQKSADAAKATTPQGNDHGAMKGMDHGAMKGMDHGQMEGMDHSKMMQSHSSEKAKAGKDDQ
jgi:uncharacterized protein involved in copper resistance